MLCVWLLFLFILVGFARNSIHSCSVPKEFAGWSHPDADKKDSKNDFMCSCDRSPAFCALLARVHMTCSYYTLFYWDLRSIKLFVDSGARRFLGGVWAQRPTRASKNIVYVYVRAHGETQTRDNHHPNKYVPFCTFRPVALLLLLKNYVVLFFRSTN